MDRKQQPVVVHHPFVPNTGQIQAREAKVADLAAERLDQLADFFIAVRDKSRPAEFEAGLKGRKRRKLTGRAAAAEVKDERVPGLDEFRRRYNNAEALQTLDLSLPALSPSPPPPQPAASSSKASSKAVAMHDIVNDSDEDADAEGEEEDEEMAVAESLAPPGVSLGTAGRMVTGAPVPQLVLPSAATTTGSPVPSSSQTRLAVSPNLEALRSASPATSAPGAFHSPASVTPQPSGTIAPTLLAPSPGGAAVSPSPLPPAVPYVPPEPYHSLFGIHEISADYISDLPPVPQEVLRNRLNTALLLRANTKKNSKNAAAAGLVQPDLYKLHVRAQHMGARAFLGPGKRVHNALSTHEWDVGIDEMRAVRAFERIEQLKQEKKWSFRQPKRQRVGVVQKSHWDHVLDEMRWLQIDVRQERRWKVVTAHTLARACRAWHRATPEQRPALCVRTRPPREMSEEELAARREGREWENPEMEVEQEAGAKPDKGKGKAQEQDEAGADADADGEEDADGEAEEATPAPTGHAVTSTASASAAPSVPVANAPPGAGKAGGTAGSEATPVPPAGALSRAQAAELEAKRAQTQTQNIVNLINFRNPIFDLGLDETIVDPLVLAALRDAASPSSDDPPKSLDEDPFLSYDFAALFPDLPLYSDFVIATDPALERRIEDSSAWAGRLTHVTRLLDTKPVLVSSLKPGRTRANGGAWGPGTAAALEDVKEPIDPREPVPTTASALFAGRKPKDASSGEMLGKPNEVAGAAQRATELLWLPEEDERLRQLQQQFGFNWPLIAQVFNLSTHRPPADHRLPWDCYDRWDKLVGPGSKKTLPDGTEIARPLPEWIPPMDPATGRPYPLVGDGSKKKTRHATILEAMKKVQKKRENYAAKQPPPGFPRRINMTMHESHNMPPRPSWTPMEWSIYKADQEQQKLKLRIQQQQALQQQQQQQQQQQAALSQSQPPQPNGVRYPPQQPNFPPGQQPPRSLPPQLAAAQAQAAARGSPNGSPALLPAGTGSPSPAPAQLPHANGAGPVPLQLPNGLALGQTPQLTPEQLALLQQRQQEMMRLQQQRAAQIAQAQAQAQAQQAAAQAAAANGVNGAGGEE
ncbi:hypothetical protein JCM10213_004337 [Rhodosporidiobolus nylandii]